MSNTPSSPTTAATPELAGSEVTFSTADGMQRGRVLRVGRHVAVFELFNPFFLPKVSDALDACKIILQGETVYSGRAVVRKIVSDGLTLTCEISLDESVWQPLGAANAANALAGYADLLREWQKMQLVGHDYKIAVADQQTYLGDLKLWLEKIELQIQAAPAAERAGLQNEIEQTLRPQVIAALHNLFEMFETVSDRIAPDHETAHHAYCRRQLHSFWLSSPFMRRTFVKPLGYAGDYEMMNMIVRNGMEGDSLFARLINSYLLDQPPCRAVRNRVGFLNNKIVAETARVAREGRRAKIISIACGPAWEATNFIAEHPLSEQAEIHFLDFNEETLRQTEKKVAELKRKHQRKTPVKFLKNSVQSLLRARERHRELAEYDLIYCSGLYDYLSDSVCRALNSHFYDQLKPDGLLVVGNFATNTPGQNLMEHLMEWFLIYRSGQELAALGPEQASPDDCAVRAEATGANIFLEARKPG
jgi:extracellular factor (EF) 3-hydroxypalmitic acid methyl ester biosynthesis protein